MREMMGFGRNDNTADVKKAFEDDMKRVSAAASADEASRSYRQGVGSRLQRGSANGRPRGDSSKTS